MTLEGGNAIKGTGLAGAIARARRRGYPKSYIPSKDKAVNPESAAIVDYLISNGVNDGKVKVDSSDIVPGYLENKIKSSGNASVSKVVEGGVSKIQVSVLDEIDILSLSYDLTLGTNLSYSGVVINGIVDSNTLGVSAILTISTNGHYAVANASGMSTMLCRGMAIESGTGSRKILIDGFIRNDSWSFYTGLNLYAGVSDGAIAQDAPVGSGDVVQAIGYAVSSNVVRFIPSLEFFETP